MNSIIYYNSIGYSFDVPTANWHSGAQSYCCTTPDPGPGWRCITLDPELLDDVHVAITSPCRGTGASRPTGPFFFGTWAPLPFDIDGEPWANPPSIGCDEVWEAGITGPLSVGLLAVVSTVVVNHNDYITGRITGRASRVAWDFGDGVTLTNQSLLGVAHSWTNVGTYSVTFTAFNTDHPEGVSTNIPISVAPMIAPQLSTVNLIGTNFALSFPSQAGVYYYLEETTNLAPPSVWEPVLYQVENGSLMQMIDTLATNDMRFYRLRVQ